MTLPRRAARLTTAVAIGALAASGLGVSAAAATTGAATSAEGTVTAVAHPPIRHVFVIDLENKGFDTTFGAGSPATYLTTTLRSQGALLTQ